MQKNNTNRFDELAMETQLRTAKVRLRAGFSAMRRHPARIAASILYFALLLLFLRKYPLLLGLEPLIARLTAPLIWICVPPLALVLYLQLVMLSAMPRHAKELSHDMYRAGLVNRAGEPPVVVSEEGSKLLVLSGGIPLADFSDNQDKLEAAINRRITRIEEGPDKRFIQLHTAPGNTKLPTRADLPKLPEGNSVIALGQTLDGPLTVDLAVTPHMLIGGSTGSGKTYLVKSITAQALAKNYKVFLIDLKGGVDFPREWQGDRCSYADNRENVLSLLSHLTHTLYSRKSTFQDREPPCASLNEFNSLLPNKAMPRIIVVCDEIAELTDTTGLDKPNKELVTAIIGQLSTLARLGRAFGIHLVLATQRPDANVLPGQIKNNIDIRICGRADLVLSQIILDNGDAAALPKDIPGRFLCNLDGGTLFQGYAIENALSQKGGGLP